MTDCLHCKAPLKHTSTQAALLEKLAPSFNGTAVALPAPGLCAGCRERQRIAFRNEWSFYRRKCDRSGRDVIAIYDESSPYTVYDPAIWWSDDYDPLDYGREFDFQRSFFEQFDELHRAVPKAAIQNAKSENCEYTNYSAENKNCYLCVGTTVSEDCYYCYRTLQSKDVCDSYDVQHCECCYECVQCTALYGSIFSRNCHSSSGLAYCENVRGSRDCFGCADLEGAQHHIFNQQFTPSGYAAERQRLQALSHDELESLRARSTRMSYQLQCEECSGEQLLNCQHCSSCFNLRESRDCVLVGSGENNTDCADCTFCDNNELQYFSSNARNNYRVCFGSLVWYCSESVYVLNCMQSKSLFGCSGMKRHEYCILNRQYSAPEYQRLAEKIAKHMRETGEWGSFFPAAISPFPYNCTLANEYYPLAPESAASLGYRWHEPEASPLPSRDKGLASSRSDIALCAVTGKPFRILAREQQLYETLGVAQPIKCPDVRRHERMGAIERQLSRHESSTSR